MLLSAVLNVHNLTYSITCLAVALVGYAFTCGIYNHYFHPLKDIPGPFWASITPLWYWRAVRKGRGEDFQLAIHKKYGKFVRIAPNQIQISDATALDTIYGPKHTFIKGDFYNNFLCNISEKSDGFSERNEYKHSYRRRCIASLYTQGAVLEYEPCVNRVIELFYKQMERFVDTNETFDMSIWLRKYTFDVIGEMYYGREGGFGFIRDNIDYNNWLFLMDIMPNPLAALNNMPRGFRSLAFVSEFLFPQTRAGAGGYYSTISNAHDAVKQRLSDIEANKPYNKSDMLSKLLDVAHDEKNDFNILDATTEVWAVIWAGSDTTYIALTAIFYFLHKHPDKLSKLLAEIDEAFDTEALTSPIRFTDAIKLPYLHAVVREAMRIHPSLGTGLPRVVPSPGVEISGRHFPAGTTVIMNQNAVHFDPAIFGDDCEQFIPERWLDDPQREKLMERHSMGFGYGKRICIGKHITMTEMYKLLPTVLRDFEFECVVPEGKAVWEWVVWRGWFHQQRNVLVKARRREKRD